MTPRADGATTSGRDRFVSYAQHGEDVVLWRALGHLDRVVYVDVGAFHPRHDSVTHALYERGWRGVNIEAQPDRLQAFVDERPEDTNLGLAIGDEDGTAVLTVPANPGWASLLDANQTGGDSDGVAQLEVPVRRLDTLLPELGLTHVDVLKVDVEGAEPAVVRGLLGGDIRPTVVVVEGEAPGLGRSAGDDAVALLVGAGYTHCMFDGLNHYLTTDSTLVSALAVPANPIDNFELDLVDRLMREREALLTTISVLAADASALRSALATEPPPDPPVLPPADEAGAGSRDRAEVASTDEQDDAAGVQSTSASDLVEAAAGTDSRVGHPTTVGLAAEKPVNVSRSVTPYGDAGTRGRRRRATYRSLLTGSRAIAVDDHSPADALVAPWDLERLAPAPLVASLYERILGRAADDEGLAVWSAHIESGNAPLDVAIALAASDEAQSLRAGPRAANDRFLRAWAAHRSLAELGLVAPSDRRYPDGRVAHAIFVDALYEVALLRRPTALESAHEVQKLVDGIGRDWMLRSFAARPEVAARLSGRADGGIRGRLRSARAQRDQLAVFRDLVQESESRTVSQLMSDVATASGGAVPPGPRGA